MLSTRHTAPRQSSTTQSILTPLATDNRTNSHRATTAPHRNTRFPHQTLQLGIQTLASNPRAAQGRIELGVKCRREGKEFKGKESENVTQRAEVRLSLSSSIPPTLLDIIGSVVND